MKSAIGRKQPPAHRARFAGTQHLSGELFATLAPLPNVPSVEESGAAGVKGFEAVGWLGLVPRRTAPKMIARCSRR